jgi:hypothetical protein
MSNLALSAAEAKSSIETREGQYKVATTTLNFATSERVELRGITDEIHSFVDQSPVRYGMVHVSTLHTTTGLVLNEIEGALISDMTTLFEQLVPRGIYYKHRLCAEERRCPSAGHGRRAQPLDSRRRGAPQTGNLAACAAGRI